ncbi:MAG TPA: tetratricopeptide repeat protein, partial [Verrucomicrobiae bacterium]
VESVAWVVERKDVLSGFFFMLTLWAWLDYAQPSPPLNNRTHRRRIEHYVLALICFALSLLAKTATAPLPCLLLLLDYWPLGRLPATERGAWRPILLEKVPFFLLSAGAASVTVATQVTVLRTAHHFSLLWRIDNVILAYATYLKHLVYPVGLAVVYPYSPAMPPAASVVGAALLLFAITAGGIIWWRKYPYMIVGWFWFLVMLLPTIDSMQATQNARADRYTYLAHIGLCLLIAWAVAELSVRWRHRRLLLSLAAAIVLAALTADAYVQTGYWKDSVTLWSRTLACTSGNYFAENTMGSALNNQGKWSEAEAHFRRSIQFKPDFPDARLNLGVTLVNEQKEDEAIEQFQLVLEINPFSAEACYRLGDALTARGKPADAISYFNRALGLKPDYSAARFGLGVTFATLGKWDESVTNFAQALHQKVDRADAQYLTAVALGAQKKWTQAIDLYQQVLQAKPEFAEAESRLGSALASQGNTSEATQHWQKALALATTQGNTPLANEVRSRLNSASPSVP